MKDILTMRYKNDKYNCIQLYFYDKNYELVIYIHIYKKQLHQNVQFTRHCVITIYIEMVNWIIYSITIFTTY